MLALLAVVGAVVGISLVTGVRVLREYERSIVFRLGRVRPRPLGPGLILLLPFGIDRSIKVDTRTRVIQIPAQEVITHDNISIAVDAVVYADVASPADAVLRVEEYLPATLQLAATTLRSVLGKMELDDILAKRQTINAEIRETLDIRTEQWGVEITAVEIKDISLPQEMKRAIARQAEAERERRAKVIMAEGELQAAAKLTEAAKLIATQPAALQLRLYQTLVEVASERNNTVIFPLPIELLQQGNTAGLASAMSVGATALAAKRQASPAQVEAAPERMALDEGHHVDEDLEALERALRVGRSDDY